MIDVQFRSSSSYQRHVTLFSLNPDVDLAAAPNNEVERAATTKQSNVVSKAAAAVVDDPIYVPDRPAPGVLFHMAMSSINPLLCLVGHYIALPLFLALPLPYLSISNGATSTGAADCGYWKTSLKSTSELLEESFKLDATVRLWPWFFSLYVTMIMAVGTHVIGHYKIFQRWYTAHTIGTITCL